MKRVLIIKQGALGDIIMSTPLIKQIQDFYKNYEIWLITAPEFTTVFENWSGLNIKYFPRKGFFNNIYIVRWIRNKKFDLLYDLQSSDRSRILVFFSGIKKRVGNRPQPPYNIHPAEKYTGEYHIHDRMLEVLSSSGIPAQREIPFLPINRDEEESIKKWLEKNNLTDKRFVILHAGSSKSHHEKRWPYFLELARTLSGNNYEIIWIGSDDDKKLNLELGQELGIDGTNCFSIPGLACLGQYATFAVTNDSAPMHILSCSGIPVYAFFGPTSWKRNHAIGQEQNVFFIEIKNDPVDSRNLSLSEITCDVVVERLIKDGLINKTTAIV